MWTYECEHQRKNVKRITSEETLKNTYWVVHKLPQIKIATFSLQIGKIKVQICGNFWVTQYVESFCSQETKALVIAVHTLRQISQDGEKKV